MHYYVRIYIIKETFSILNKSTSSLSVGHGKSLVTNFSILFIIICMYSHLKGVDSGGYPCDRGRREGIATVPATI